jgi:hypothetical protein
VSRVNRAGGADHGWVREAMTARCAELVTALADRGGSLTVAVSRRSVVSTG